MDNLYSSSLQGILFGYPVFFSHSKKKKKKRDENAQGVVPGFENLGLGVPLRTLPRIENENVRNNKKQKYNERKKRREQIQELLIWAEEQRYLWK